MEKLLKILKEVSTIDELLNKMRGHTKIKTIKGNNPALLYFAKESDFRFYELELVSRNEKMSPILWNIQRDPYLAIHIGDILGLDRKELAVELI